MARETQYNRRKIRTQESATGREGMEIGREGIEIGREGKKTGCEGNGEDDGPGDAGANDFPISI